MRLRGVWPSTLELGPCLTTYWGWVRPGYDAGESQRAVFQDWTDVPDQQGLPTCHLHRSLRTSGSRGTRTRCGVHMPAARRRREASAWDKKPRSTEAAVKNRPRQRQLPRPELDPGPPSTPALPSPARPDLPHSRPARPRAHPPPGAGTPRRRAGTRGCCSGTRSRSAAPGRPATHSGAERAGRFIRSPSSGCTNLRPCPHPEARPNRK